MGRAGADHKRWTVILFGGILLGIELALGTVEDTCNCRTTTDFQDFQAALAPEICCLNFTGTKIGSLDWGLFSGAVGLRELYLSNCSISDFFNTSDDSSTLEILYLDHNQLRWLPDSFLRNAPRLRVIELKSNQLQELPESFLKASSQIQEIHLDFNNLSSLSSEIFKPSLLTLGLSNNSWDCTCTLLGDLESYLAAPFYSGVICSTPKHFSGLDIKTIPKQELCQTYKLTALFICLPLVAILALVLWCFCKQKETGYDLHGGKECRLATAESNCAKQLAEHHCYIPCELPTGATTESEKNILRNQVLLKPSATLLGSSRDLYEEVEIKLGASDDSLVQTNEGSLDQEILGPKKLTTAEEGCMAGGLEAETVSVTDVLKDSADREKLYMNHSVDYYNLVPGIELEDSDHMEYENVDLC
ncbi:uncharacterized protein LOC143835763 [Paroedura picta]|uniref:uncharacterized protein LOC143835763 n=1 Tax=Paroedura picta TaxID=143630 RepID=UPI001014AE97